MFVRLNLKGLFMATTNKRFDLEEAIMAAWQTEKDIELVYESLYEELAIDNDVFANFMLGLAYLHSARMSKVWSAFEGYLKEVHDERNKTLS